jgi:hypothetical protein
MEESWERTFEVDGRVFTARFLRRPFREGLEVYVDCDGVMLSVPELGLGEAALIERASSLVKEQLARLRHDS